MTGRAYYNEIDPFAAAWLRSLIAAGHIAPGDVDERSIVDIRPADLKGYTQCHFFAGIGVWSYALRLAGWPDDAPVWTGSCPCQPFSSAGKGAGFADERHLWPHFHYLIEQCQPRVVFGEQVASKDGLSWLDLVQADLEATGYASGAVDLCAAGVGAPHIRQRLWWVAERMADADSDGREAGREIRPVRAELDAEHGRTTRRLGDDDDARLEGQRSGHQAASGRDGAVRPVAEAGELGGLADADRGGLERIAELRGPIRDGKDTGRAESCGRVATRSEIGVPGPTNGFWRDADWLLCRDARWRPVEPGTFPLAHGAPARVGRLRGYGNAIVAQAAQAFIESYLDAKAVALEVAA